MVPASEKDGYEFPEATEQKEAQSDENAGEEYQEWVANGSDCSDAVVRELGRQAMIAVTFECEFNEDSEEAPTGTTPTDEEVGIGAPTTGPTADLSNDVGPSELYTYDEALAAFEGGESYYSAFCVNYVPTTSGGEQQRYGIEQGYIDSATGEPLN